MTMICSNEIHCLLRLLARKIFLENSDLDLEIQAILSLQVRLSIAWSSPKRSLARKSVITRSLVEGNDILTGEPQRRFKEFQYTTLNSWSRERRVIGKAECLDKGFNPRFIVTSLEAKKHPGRKLYERDYCGRGEMENRIKEQQLYLFGSRTSAHRFRANQLRLWFSGLAYVLLESLRRLGLKGTKFERARCDTIRLKLLKIGARVKVTARRIWTHLASSYPYQELFIKVWKQLERQNQ